MKGKDITELIAIGREKFASVPSGGGGAIAVAAPAGAAAGGGAAAPAAAEPKKEEKVEEKEESDEVKFVAWIAKFLSSEDISTTFLTAILCYSVFLQDMGFSLFD